MKKFILILLVLLELQIQAQINPCDSITYWTDQSQGFNIGLDTSNMVHNPDSIEVWWAVCTNSMCYSGQGMYDYFPQVMLTDTLKVCHDVYLYTSNVVELCTHCDSLIFDQNSFSWVLFNMGNPTYIKEISYSNIKDNNIYDLLGRKLEYIPTGKMYIRNNKLHISR